MPPKMPFFILSALAIFLCFSPAQAAEEGIKPSRLLKQIQKASPSELRQIAETVLTQEPYRSDLGLTWAVLERLDSSTGALRHINRYVLGQVQGQDDAPMMQILRIASQITRAERRQAFLKQATQALSSGNSSQIADFISAHEPYQVPAGYRMIRTHLGTGKNGRVSLIERLSDGALFAWKLPTVDDPKIHEAFAKEERYGKEWRRYGQTDMQVFFADDGVTLLKSFVQGPTLKKLMQQKNIFQHPESAEYQALVRFVRLVASSQQYISGLNAENIVFDGKRWQIIDGARATEMPTRADAFQKLREAGEKKWARDELIVFQPEIQKFFTSLAPELAQPGIISCSAAYRSSTI